MNKVISTINRLIKPFPGKWVALSSDDRRVVGVAKSANAAVKEARKKGEQCPHLVKAPDSSTSAFIF